jgi:hypothetical protein
MLGNFLVAAQLAASQEGLSSVKLISYTWEDLDQWYSTFFVRVPPDIISLQLCTPKVVGV